MSLLTKIWNRNDSIVRVLMFISCIILLVLIFPKEKKFLQEYNQGKPWLHNDLIAEFDFPILKDEATYKQEKEEIIRNIKPYYNFNNDISEVKKKEFTETYQNINLNNQIIKFGAAIIDTIYKKGIIRMAEENGEKGNSFIITLKDNKAEEKNIGSFYTIKTASDFIKANINKLKLQEAEKNTLTSYLIRAMDYNVVYNPELTEAEKELKLKNLSSTAGMIQSGQVIITKGEIINAEKHRILDSYKEEYSKQVGTPKKNFLLILGQGILISLSITVFYLFLLNFRKQIFDDNKKILLNLLLILIIISITSLLVKNKPEFIYLIPISIIPIVIRAFFDTRLALFVLIVILTISGYLVPDSFEFTFLQLITGIITIISIRKLENRGQFFLTSLLIFISYSLTYTGIKLIEKGDFTNIDTINYAFFGANAMLSLFSYPMIFLFEKSFGFITNVSLMELSGSNSSLLRELSSRTPGTFQHSMQVANLAEEAIYKIGGNGLLARTGALYHDVGKMDMGMYFIENQVGASNPHDDLSYEESANIIINHVSNGIHIAKKYKIPEQIIDFIRTHHGTTKTRYFYKMYLKNIPEDELIDSSIFTYHGPIPFSRETAVIMMADAVEAASRSLEKYDEESISNLVESVINKQISENQLVNSDITLKDINEIKKIFKKQIMNIYHIRIAYPA